ncbi:MAG: argininosuccinate lyase [Candidatus Bathyarchaeia archaeon]
MARGLLKGRLERRLAEDALDFLVREDLECDRQLVEEDILCSEAHAIMLWKCKIITRPVLRELLKALEKARNLHAEGKFKLELKLDDVHLNLEDFVIREAGMDVGGWLHTGRSRNDQIATDMRLYLRREVNEISGLIVNLLETIFTLAKRHFSTVMPGYTHLQIAQPITYAHWLSSLAEMLLRDLDRLEGIYARINMCPLGAGALAGTSWPIDRKITAELLGFDGVQINSLDAVTARGEEAADILAALSILMVHLSRLAGDLVIWSSYEFRMVELDEAYATGSSIMPQKKNPDVAELIRAKASSVQAQLYSVLSLVRALPSGYFRDLQETKPAVMSAIATVKRTLDVTQGMLSTLKVNKKRMLELATSNYSTATDLANMLVREKGIPFRLSHQIVGAVVRNALEAGVTMADLKAEAVIAAAKMTAGKEIVITQDELRDVADPLKSVKAKRSMGSPNPLEVRKNLRELQSRLKKKARNLAERVGREKKAESVLHEMVEAVISS